MKNREKTAESGFVFKPRNGCGDTWIKRSAALDEGIVVLLKYIRQGLGIFLVFIALLHDCGKCYVPDSILKKPNSLSAEEYAIMKEHTIYGAKMLENFTSVPYISEVALYHHEHYDGSGYPYGMKEKDIPLLARIMGVADAFDVMNSNRCYRNKYNKEKIIEELIKCKRTQFDPKIADVLIDLIGSGEITLDDDSNS